MGQQACCAKGGGQAVSKKRVPRLADEHVDVKRVLDDDSVLRSATALTVDQHMEANMLLDEDDKEILGETKRNSVSNSVGGGLFSSEPAEPAAPKNEVPLSKTDDNIGDHVCAKVGEEAANKFISKGILKKLLEESKEDMGKNFSLDQESIDSTVAGKGCGIAMAVSDPMSEDCPLVFVSNGFEDLTGYTAEFVVGRSCRFLQPTSKVLNDGVNLLERKMMRHFCTEIQPGGTSIINLLLNEQQTGERFWNLLRMQYVTVDGHQYIFGVQTTLNAFMPKLLSKRLLGSSKNANIVDALGPFLHALEGMREEIRKTEFMPMMELKGYYTCALNMLQMLPALEKLNGMGTGLDFNKVIAGGDIATAAEEANAPVEEVRLPVVPGCTVSVEEELKYPTYKVAPKSTGKVLSIDSFGTASIEWQGIGKKGCLKRDIGKLKVIPEAGMDSPAAGS